MNPVIDHIFICTSSGAPAAELLKRAGLIEGQANRHPGQGTACRRFFFSNGMLELLWLEEEAAARSDQTQRTRLWERLAGPGPASPFGIVLRSESNCPWRSWTYAPPTMPGLKLEIAADTDLDEPMWCFMKDGPRPSLDHPGDFENITRVLISCPGLKDGSVTSTMAASGVIDIETGVEHRLELQFDGGRRGKTLDFRPALPLIMAV
jgi:hypothetical protein